MDSEWALLKYSDTETKEEQWNYEVMIQNSTLYIQLISMLVNCLSEQNSIDYVLIKNKHNELTENVVKNNYYVRY